MYNRTIQQFGKMLFNLSNLMDKAEKHAEAKKFDVSNILNSRLAPDMMSFTRQVQIACDNAKAAAARLSGQEAPKHEDNEKTVAELKARITKVTDYLKGFNDESFNGGADRVVILPFMPHVSMTGDQYLHEFVIPNFYFHLTTAYDILRHNGLEIGKVDFVGHIDMKPVQAQ